ncbi:hypothetical protein RhiTH_001120 [Rhizoctonia solani]
MPIEHDPGTQRLATATGVGEAMVHQLMNSTESPSRSGALTIGTWGERLVLVLGLCHSLSRSVALHESNYVVLTGAQAIKIEFDHSEEDAVARRVSCCFKSKSLTAKARKNVVLPAGILLTPQLLKLGGVGNENVLKKHKISLNVNLPVVGENYQDHISVLIIYKVKKAFVAYDNLGYNHTFRAAAEAQYKKTRNGPLTTFHFMLSHVDLGYLVSSSTIAHIHRSLWKDVKKEKPKVLQKDQYTIQEL